MTMNVNDVKDWGSLINQLNQPQLGKTARVGPQNRKNASLPAEQKAKPTGVPTRTAPKTGDSAQVKAGVERLSETKLLFSIESLLALLFEVANNQRKARRESRMADASVAEEMSMASAEDIHDEAVMSITGAVLSAAAQVGGAATVVGGGIHTAKTENVMEVSNKMMSYQATSQTFGSMGQVTKGGFDYEEKQDEAQKALHDASATQAKSIEDSDNEDQKDEGQLVQSIIQLQQQQEESRHEAMRSTA